MDGTTKLFTITYAIIKDVLPAKLTKKNVAHPISIILSALVLVLIYVALIPFILFRFCLWSYLKIIYGDSFGGFLSGLDVIFEMLPQKTVINVVNIYSTSDAQSTYVKIKELVAEIHTSSFKFSSKIERVLGYCFYVKDSVRVEQIIKKVTHAEDSLLTREMLYDYLERNGSTLEENQMWKVTMFEQPITWSDGSEKRVNGLKQYAIIWSIRHSLCDGPAVITTFQKHALREAFEPLEIPSAQMKLKPPRLTLKDACVRRNPITSTPDGTALEIKGNTNWHLATFIERRPKYVGVVRRIKRRLNVTFVEVLSAAIVASVHDYIKERKVTLDNFNVAKVIRMQLEDLLMLREGKYRFEQVENNFGLIGQEISQNLDTRNMRELILSLHRYNESLRNAVDYMIAYSILRHIHGYLPIGMTRSACASFMDAMTIGITNLIGFRQSTLCDNVIDDIFFFAPDVLNTAFTFSIFTYDDRFQVVLTSRKGFVNNKEELQRMLDNVFKYVDRIEEEVLRNE